MSVKVTTELIEKYHKGLCSREEMGAVEMWLSNPEPDTEFTFPDDLAEEHKTSMWNIISEGLSSKEQVTRLISIKNLFGTYTRYATAACILICTGMVMYAWFGTKQLVIDNLNGNGRKYVQANGLAFSLMPESKAEAGIGFLGNSRSLRFCGAIEVKNESDKDIELEFHSSCLKTKVQDQKIVCKKGKSYLVMHIKFKRDEIFIVEKDQVYMTTPRIMGNISKVFNI